MQRSRTRTVLCAAVLSIGLGAAAAQDDAKAASDPLARLAWLAGCWRGDNAEAGNGEQWLPLAGRTLLGVSRTVRQGATVSHEFMQIREAADGKVVFVAQPAGQAETAFVLLPGPDLEAVFENLANDYPQRVIYRLETGGRLRARIEGGKGAQARGADFPMTRTACDAQPPLPEAFQGLPWGAGETQMALRFGPLLKKAVCPPLARRGPGRPTEACDHPLVEPYEVAGVPFRLNLHVDDATRQLVRVSLVHGVEALAATQESGWGEKHRLLRQLLTQRYGGPESTHVASEGALSHATARWRRGDTLIELSSRFHPAAAGSPASEQLEIVYKPVTAGDAGRL